MHITLFFVPPSAIQRTRVFVDIRCFLHRFIPNIPDMYAVINVSLKLPYFYSKWEQSSWVSDVFFTQNCPKIDKHAVMNVSLKTTRILFQGEGSSHLLDFTSSTDPIALLIPSTDCDKLSSVYIVLCSTPPDFPFQCSAKSQNLQSHACICWLKALQDKRMANVDWLMVVNVSFLSDG